MKLGEYVICNKIIKVGLLKIIKAGYWLWGIW